MSTAIRLGAFVCAALLAACASGEIADDSAMTTAATPSSATTASSAATATGPSDAGRRSVGPAPTPTSIGDSGLALKQAPPRATILVADQLRRYLDRVLGGPLQPSSLHGHIREVSVGLHVAAIHTDLSSDELDRATAERICLIASWFRRSPEGRHVTALDVEVYGQAGDLIASYEDLPALASSSSGVRNPRQAPARSRPVAGAPSPTPGRSTLDRHRDDS